MIKITWDETMAMCKQLAHTYKGKSIWGVPRGGAVVAGIMSFHGCLLARDIHLAQVIIDDVADTGCALTDYTQPTAVLMLRKGCNPQPSTYIRFIASEEYILMPYEDEAEILEQIAQGRFRSNK